MLIKAFRRWSVVFLIVGWCGVTVAVESDWPTHHYDNQRSAVTRMPLADDLHLQWTHQSSHAPMPAWPEPLREFHRMPFDYSYQMVSADGLLLYGSNADCKLYALDIGTGKVRWTFFTEGPIRFSPAIFDGKVYLASDDGFLYCLTLATGDLVWKQRIGPKGDIVVGNERMIGRWPLRSGAMVKDGIVYVTAGMWNVDGVYISAFDAGTGDLVWQNDTANHIYLIATHGEEGIVNVPPQGYLLENDGSLVVPTGRGAPAGFDLATGKFLWYQVEFGKPHHAGGSYAFVHDGMVFTQDRKCNAGVAPIPHNNTADEFFHGWVQGLMAWDTRSGNEGMCVADVQRAVADGGTIFCANETKLVAADFGRLRKDCWDLRGVIESDTEVLNANAGWMTKFGIVPAQSKLNAIQTKGRTYWETEIPHRVYDMIAAGDKICLGSRDSVAVYDRGMGEKVFEAKVEGRVRGLIAAGGKLFASTTTGAIHCFGPDKVPSPPVHIETKEDISAESDRVANEALASTGIKAGRALVLGSDVALAAGLATNSNLVVACFDDDRDRMAAAREKLDGMGLYGPQVTLHRGEAADMPFTDYFANLIVATDELTVDEMKELCRVLRPYGGKAYLARANVKGMLIKAGVPADEIRTGAAATIIERGELAGAGSWTHQYGDTQNTYNSGDSIVRAPFQVQWWGGPGPAKSVNRHQYGPNPIATDGKFFMTGRHTITCGDMYNGFEYWTFRYPNIGRIGAKSWGGGKITDGETVYVASGDSCLLIDVETGTLKNVFRAPVIKELYSVNHTPTFSVEGDPETTGRVTLKKDAKDLTIELTRKDKTLTKYDGWDLFFDFRSNEKRELVYTPGAFRIHVEERAEEGPKAVAVGDTKSPDFTTDAGITPDGSHISIMLPWTGLAKLTGSPVKDFRFGFSIVTAPADESNAPVTPEEASDPRKRMFQKTFLLAESYNERLTLGLGDFTLGEAGKIGDPGFYDSGTQEAFTWNYSAVSDGLLFGSASRENFFEWHGRPASNPEDEFLFALDKKTGELQWLIKADDSFNPFFTGIDETNIYFVDKEHAGKIAHKERRGVESKFPKLVAADKFTGKIVWANTNEAFAGKDRLQIAKEVVCLSAGDRGIAAISKVDGSIVWNNDDVKNSKPPVLVKDKIYWKPNEYDIGTGDIRMGTHPVTGDNRTWEFHTVGRGGCGEMSGCDNLVFFRDGYLAYHDLVNDDGEHWVGGIRPSCSSNILPVGGLVVQPEGSSGCTCSGFSFQTCFALAPAPARQEQWTMLKGNANGMQDINDLKVNFGAPGDRKVGDDWYLAFPRKFRPSYQRLPIVAGDGEVEFSRRNPDTTDITGTDMDWFYGSQAENVRRLHMDLLFNLPAVATKVTSPVAIDGKPNVAFAGNANRIMFCDVDKTIYHPAGAVLSYDDDNLYVTLKREAAVRNGQRVPWTTETSGENALTWKDDSWSIRLNGKGTVSFDISVSGARRVDVYKPFGKECEWSWKSAVYVSPEDGTWTTEVAIPWSDLETNIGGGMDAGWSVYIQGINKTGVGPEMFEYKYRTQEKHKIANGTAPLSLDPLPPSPEKQYTLSLHFAELDNVKPGDRVFDVRAQGQTIIEGIDIVKEAGGTLKPLVKHVTGISGTDYLDIELAPQKGSLPPTLSGLELKKH